MNFFKERKTSLSLPRRVVMGLIAAIDLLKYILRRFQGWGMSNVCSLWTYTCARTRLKCSYHSADIEPPLVDNPYRRDLSSYNWSNICQSNPKEQKKSTIFYYISINICSKTMHLRMSSAIYLPFWSGLNGSAATEVKVNPEHHWSCTMQKSNK